MASTPLTTEASGLKATEEAVAAATMAANTPPPTSTTTPAATGAAPTPTDEAASETTIPGSAPPTTPPTTSFAASTAAPAPMVPASSPVISPTSLVASLPSPGLASPGLVRPSTALELTARVPPATPVRPATAVRSAPQPVVLDSPTPAHQMALQLLRSGMAEETRRSRALASLLTLPDARHLEFRSLIPADLPNLARVQNLEAAVAFTAGEVAQPPCTDCDRGHGQFVECVSVVGFLHGSCANCHFGGEGKRCSLRARLLTALAATSSTAPLLSTPAAAPITGSPSGRSSLHVRHAVKAATSYATEALTEEALRGRKRRATSPSTKDSRPARRPRVTAARVRATTRASVAATTGLVPVPRAPLDYQLELENAVAQFRVASPSSRERLRLVHSLEGVAMQIVTSSEGNPSLFQGEDEEEDEEEEEEGEEEAA
ncbi:hypothetical protein VC83_07957 [Pseudogymnoascus destructans]|uniref:Uncharacterized protein n=1 Tax=Pseudogymnoascus destructans TaxID=655981 RepID=A0A177A4X7_9PEZI|nr:uncharacterized protein VC83_07957 [Pseudogymnoascus destructans]OAF56004.1 hypothetical protein VC83_07957 [Pseudogymnoascus destructans]